MHVEIASGDSPILIGTVGRYKGTWHEILGSWDSAFGDSRRKEFQ
jgi:hypothetical protein